MTPLAWLERGRATLAWAWDHRTLVLVGLVASLAAFSLHACDDARRAKAQLAAAAALAKEEGKARKADVPVVQQVPQATVDEEAARALAEQPELQAAKTRLEKEVGRLRAIMVVRGETAAAPAKGSERPGEPPTGAAPGPAVLLRFGDQLKLKYLGVEEEGGAGSRSLLVSIGVERVADGQELHRGVLSVAATKAWAAPPAVPCQAALERAWRAGPVAGVSTAGWLAGGVYARRVDLWVAKPELVVVGGAGPGAGFLVAGAAF